MSAIRLNRPLELETPVTVSDGAGGYMRSWQALGTVWAEVLAGTGREAAGEEISLAQTGYRITVRAAVPGSPQRPRAGQRFREGARIFTILAVTERDAAGNYLRCFAREEVPR